jgi:hypothetical protein
MIKGRDPACVSGKGLTVDHRSSIDSAHLGSTHATHAKPNQVGRKGKVTRTLPPHPPTSATVANSIAWRQRPPPSPRRCLVSSRHRYKSSVHRHFNNEQLYSQPATCNLQLELYKLDYNSIDLGLNSSASSDLLHQVAHQTSSVRFDPFFTPWYGPRSVEKGQMSTVAYGSIGCMI